MHLLDSTHSHQSALASFCRTGKLVEIPGVYKENIGHYRRLVFNVVDDMLQNAYPLTYDLLTTKEWKTSVSDFFINHACQSPQVWYMPKEFYTYFKETNSPLLKKYPFLIELLAFEWVEVELFMMEDIACTAQLDGDIRKNKLILNPEHQLLSFQFPVHLKPAKKITDKDKGNYFVIAHRNIKGEVLFTDTSAALVRMVEYLLKSSKSVIALIKEFEREYEIKLAEDNQKTIFQFFENAYHKQLIIGFSQTS